jgi:RHH-type proline utilization regulon transcriptional repressor/proline dehydrogenase/delta 1-pyrroline-5-carboxylate dehydrogenase
MVVPRMKLPDTIADSALVDRAVAVARALQIRATALQTPAERRQQAELDRMLQTPEDKVTLVQLTDEAFRSQAARRTAEHLTHILDVQGVPRFFSPLDRALLRGFQTFGDWLPAVSVPLVKEHMQHETANVVLPAETDLLREHLRARQRDGVRMNLNFLGETVLGEEEASRRLAKYLEALQLPEVEVVSVKISTLYSQISALARTQTLRVLCDRLELLYRSAARLPFQRADGVTVPKFIYLDMEEYRDLQLTAQAFMETLDRPGLEGLTGGIALQAYIPDSAQVQREITAWARRRVNAGGAPVTIRIVKGANMEMERVEASVRGWPQAPFLSKRETDANYKRLLREALCPENLAAVRIGVASHNLFDLAYGLVLAAESSAGDRVQFEMLEGMANHQRRALLEQTRHMLLYAPACRKEEFLNAIGYLIRRLDENTGPENFLRHAFKLEVGAPEWEVLERGFREAFRIVVADAPRRTQNRLTERFDQPRAEMQWDRFENEPDTDWSLPANSEWAQGIVAPQETGTLEIPLVVDAEAPLVEPRVALDGRCLDPSRPGVVLAHYTQASGADIDRAVACAKADRSGWRSLGVDARSEIFGRVAQELRRARAPLMWAALANGGKTLAESDAEVSEAVDFVEFYRASARSFFEHPDLGASPRGVVVVVPPWNFPIAIPCGGIAAALAAGNTVILKPASDTVLVAWELCRCFWRAGVPLAALQFVPCPGRGAGAQLVAHPDVDAVILTGGTATAWSMLKARPALRLFAETGGKNATVVTALSDRELAIKHVVQSAFGHSGQKCSATSLLLLEAEVYDDEHFQHTLCDAVKSLSVGSAWDLETRVGPLIRPPSGDLETALQTLEPGENWAVLPQRSGTNPNLWSPGVKYGVTRGSVTHLTEFFGPLLGVMRFERLAEAIDVVNATGYGLTSGIHSLDDREIEQWKRGIKAGNLYVNRGTTGAIVLRQPFGGMGRSCIGPGIKAGGPNYVACFMDFSDAGDAGQAGQAAAVPVEIRNADLAAVAARLPISAEGASLRRAVASYDRMWHEEFSREHDHFRLLGQDNILRALPFPRIAVRITPADEWFDVVARVAAARVTGARVLASFTPGCPPAWRDTLDDWTDSWAGGIELLEQTDAAVIALLGGGDLRIRYGARDRVPTEVRRAAAATGQWIADVPVVGEGRVELLWYLREQSISHDYHRYGNLGRRAAEPRRPLRGETLAGASAASWAGGRLSSLS